MTVYVPEEFTPGEEDVLRRYFTNLDGPVFALVNLPEVVKGALFARYSRSPKSLRRLFLDEFGDLGELTNLVDLMKLGRSKGAAAVLGAQDVADIDSIYGKDRSRTILGNAQNLGIVFDDLRAGTARRIIRPGHAFSRIHRDDIARALLAAAGSPPPPGLRVLHLVDDEPTESAVVVLR